MTGSVARSAKHAPLLALAVPGDKVGAGEDELVAVAAVEVPGACIAVHDRLVGAEDAFGRCGLAGEVDGQGLGLRSGHRLAAGKGKSGLSCPGPRDPDCLECFLECGFSG